MYLDIRTSPHKVIRQLPAHHVFIASSNLGEDQSIDDGCSTGDFQLFDEMYHIAEGFLPFNEMAASYDNNTQIAELSDIVIAEDGKSAARTWIVRDKTPEELAADLAQKWANIRTHRNSLLQQSDWTQLADSSCAALWADYRQVLRDIPEIYATPDVVIWPTNPEV